MGTQIWVNFGSGNGLVPDSGVAVAAYVRLTSRSQAKFPNNENESHSILRAQTHMHIL